MIALITMCNIINSISMSVSSRTKQYGTVRAIGLSIKQLGKMIVAVAVVLAVWESVQKMRKLSIVDTISDP